MAIRYDARTRSFHLADSSRFSFLLRIVTDDDGTRTLLHQYWGAPIYETDVSYLGEDAMPSASFDLPSQKRNAAYPAKGSGDYRIPALTAIGADGIPNAVLSYEGYEILSGKKPLQGLPALYTEAEAEAETLYIDLKDALTGLRVRLAYTVMTELHLLTESVLLINEGKEAIRLENPASASISLSGSYYLIHLCGAWARERTVERVSGMHGIRGIASHRGASGHEHNPFIALAEPSATEFAGNVYGMCLVYSGCHRMQVEENAYGYTRFVGGIEDCSWTLHPGESFQTPEMVLVYSDQGFNRLSQTLHNAFHTRLCRGVWRDRERPVLINNWEGTYFDFNEEKLLAIARKAAGIGVELFVLDDGWFGRRNNDRCSLGDWVENPEKLPHGLSGLANAINALGLKFGLWFEPEMVSPDSDLYRAHPDWCLHIDGRTRHEARNQLILDLSRPDVQRYILDSLSTVLSSAHIEYVKWDMNRNFSEAGSAMLPPEQQGELCHRYMLGLYAVLEELTSRFPDILFECCSGGGGRFDAGMLFYMPQVWTSDDTDAVERLSIQYGTSYAYPPCSMGAHVSAVPCHQTGRSTSLPFRAHVAMSGIYGYELDLTRCSEEELAQMKEHIAQVKSYRHLTMKGRFTRLLSPFDGTLAAWQFADESRSELLIFLFRKTAQIMPEPCYVKIPDIDERAWYEDDNGMRYHGSLLRNIGIIPAFQKSFAGWQDAASEVLHLTRLEKP